jgi:hypothetical protein
MKKIILPVIALVLIALLGIFLAGLGKAPVTPAQETGTGNLEVTEIAETHVAAEQPVLQDEPEEQESTTPCFGFGDVLPTISGDSINIEGSVFDDVPFVQLYCSNGLVGTYDVIAGAFSIDTDYSECAPGTAEIKYECNGQEFSTTEEILPRTIFQTTGRNSGGSDITILNSNTPSHMPEFSVFTLGLAIIGVGLGLALLRKH